MSPKLNSLPHFICLFPLVVFWGFVLTVKAIWNMFTKTGFFHVNERKRRPKIMDDPDLGSHQFVQLSHVKLHYVAAGDPGKPLMLFVHGFPECWFSWRFQMKHFKHKYRVVAIDMRGYCESEKPSGIESYWMLILSGDIKELLEKLGYEKCILVAHDWGGAVAFDFLLRNPDMVDKFIFCNAPHPRAFMEGFSMKQLLMSWYIFFFQLPWLPEIVVRSFDFDMLTEILTNNGQKFPGQSRCAVDEEEMEAFKFSAAQPGCVEATINYYRAMMRYKRVPYPQGSHIKVPSCMIWGLHDAFLSKALAECCVKYFDKLKVNWIETAGHWVQQEEPDKVNKCMAQFLDS